MHDNLINPLSKSSSVLVGGQELSFRPMTREDHEAVKAFVQSLPEEDLLFLSLDITRPEAISQWIDEIEAGRATTILAVVDESIVGYASLYYNQLRWMRHLGEIRIQVSPMRRGLGLGKLLIDKIFAIAQTLSLRKVIAQMPTEQHGAVQVFDRLGFKAEALLADHVIDRENRTHDLIVMSFDITGFTS